MIAIEKLRYIRLGVADLDKSADFASRIIGLQEYGGDEKERRFRSDERDHTLELYQSDKNHQALAMEVRTMEALSDASTLLTNAGYNVAQGDEAMCAIRGVKAMLSFQIRQGAYIELVLRPLNAGWRYHAPRDAGITSFFGVAFASTDVEKDTKLWTEIFGARIADYVGNAVYLSLDEMHSRIIIYPSDTDRLLDIQFEVEEMHHLMVNSYYLQSMQVPIVHGPGKRATSEQYFISFKSPDDLLFSYVAEGNKLADDQHLARQFPHAAKSFCAWGSRSELKIFGGDDTE